MPAKPTIGTRDLPCPNCGYDLRASPRSAGGVRCPECGTTTRLTGDTGLTASRLPWAHRRWRGRARTFFATLWMVLLQPGQLARALEVPARPADARRFRLICMLLATLAGTASLMLTMAGWDTDGWWVLPAFRIPALIPASLLLDHWYGAIPVALAVYAANWMCAELYRWILCLGGGPGPRGEPHYLRRRMAALGHYGAGMLLLESLLLGFFWILWVLRHDWTARHYDVALLTLVMVAVGGVAVLAYLPASLGLALQTGRWRGLRAALMLAYPFATYILWIAVVTAINWVIGYVALGVRSMLA